MANANFKCKFILALAWKVFQEKNPLPWLIEGQIDVLFFPDGFPVTETPLLRGSHINQAPEASTPLQQCKVGRGTWQAKVEETATTLITRAPVSPSLQESNIDTPKMSKSEMAEKMHCHNMWTGDTILIRRNTFLSAVKEGRHILWGKTRNPPASDPQGSLGLQVYTTGPDGVLKTEPCREAALKSCPFRNPGFFFSYIVQWTTCSEEVVKDQIWRTLSFPKQYLFHFHLLFSGA